MTHESSRSIAIDLVSIDDLAKVHGSKRAALQLVKKLRVPIHDGLLSRRLLLARMELSSAERTREGDYSLFNEEMARHGLYVVRAHLGRRKRVVLGVERDVRVGQLEVGLDEDSPYRPTVVRAGENVEARLCLVAGRDKRGMATFNLVGLEDPNEPQLILCFIADESRLLVFHRRELVALRDNLDRSDRERGFSRWRGDGIRISIRRGATDFDATNRIVPTTGAGR